jgi:hypothetical protein
VIAIVLYIVRRSRASIVRMVNFLHNHYANDKVMRAKIERKVKALAKNKGIDARGAEGIEIYVFQLFTSLFNMM